MGMEELYHGPYKIDVSHVLEGLRVFSARKVLIQAPLGFRGIAAKLAVLLNDRGFTPVLSNSACWGGCDIAYSEAEQVKADAILHLGHSPFMRRDKIPTIYVECRYADPSPLMNMLPKIREALRGERVIGLGASVQWLDHVTLLASYLEDNGIATRIAKPSMFAMHYAQVLGCDYSGLKQLEADVDAFMVLGSVFHALGIALLTSKTTYAIDPVTQTVKELDEHRRRILMQRYANIQKFAEASRIGVIVSTKPGQMRSGLAVLLEHVLRDNGKHATIIATDEIDDKLITDYPFEAYVNTACPRISVEDQARYAKPVLLPAECLVALRLLSWEDIINKGMLMLPWGWSGEASKIFWKILNGSRSRREEVGVV